MATVLGGSGVFTGPTRAQLQQSNAQIAQQGLSGFASSAATERSLIEAKRQAIDAEIWKYAQDYGAQMGVPAASAFDDPNFRAFAVQKYGNVLGGLFGIGGQARAQGQVDALGRMDTGQLAAQQDVERQFRSGNLSLGQEVQSTIDQDQVNQYLASLKQAGPPQPAPAPVAPGQTPPPAPGTTPPPATGTPVDGKVGSGAYTVGMQGIPPTSPGNPLAATPEGFQRGEGPTGSRTQRDAINNASTSLLLSSKNREEYGINLQKFMSGEFTADELYRMAQAYAQPKDPKTGMVRPDSGNYVIAKAAMDAADIMSSGEISRQALPFIPEAKRAEIMRSKTTPAAAPASGSPSGVGAGTSAAAPAPAPAARTAAPAAPAKIPEPTQADRDAALSQLVNGPQGAAYKAAGWDEKIKMSEANLQSYMQNKYGGSAAAPAASTTTPAPDSTSGDTPDGFRAWVRKNRPDITGVAATGADLRNRPGNENLYAEYKKSLGSPATPASTTGATPSSSLDVARKLGLSAEEVAAINKAGSAEPGSMSSAEYALYRRGMEKIKNAAVKETRTTKLEIKPGMENDPYVQDAVRLYGIMDPNGPYAKDPRTVQLTENLASLAIQGKKAEMERNLAAAGLDRAQAEVVKGNAMASSVLAEAEMMKAQNENLKNLMTALDSSVKPLFENYSKELSTAKNETEVESVKKKYADLLSNDPVFKGVYDVYVDILKKRGGDQYQVNLKEVLIDKYFFGINVGQESAGKVASVNTGATGQDPTGGLTITDAGNAYLQSRGITP